MGTTHHHRVQDFGIIKMRLLQFSSPVQEAAEKWGEVCGVVGDGCGDERDDWLAIGGLTLVEGITELVELEDRRRFLLRFPYLDNIGILFFLRDLLGLGVSSTQLFLQLSCRKFVKDSLYLPKLSFTNVPTYQFMSTYFSFISGILVCTEFLISYNCSKD